MEYSRARYEDFQREHPFAGLERPMVCSDGSIWAHQAQNFKKVGRLIVGDKGKLVGRIVDIDGNVIDQHCNILGYAGRDPQPGQENAVGCMPNASNLSPLETGERSSKSTKPLEDIVGLPAADRRARIMESLMQAGVSHAEAERICDLHAQEARSSEPPPLPPRPDWL